MGRKRKLEDNEVKCIGPLSKCAFLVRRLTRNKRRRLTDSSCNQNSSCFLGLPAAVGAILDERYELEQLIGCGGFGKVFRAKDNLQESKSVAVKIIEKTNESHMDGVKEVLTLRKINTLDPDDKHFCVRLLNSFCCQGHICLIFPELGPTVGRFSQHVRCTPYSLEEIHHIGYQLCSAVGFLHEQELMHNDIKPDNMAFVNKAINAGSVFKKDNFDIRLIDFGSVTRPYDQRNVARTQLYSPPEHLIKAQNGYGYDVWSIGCTFFEMYTGNLLFAAETHIEHLALIEQVCGRLPQSLTDCNSQIFKPDGRVKLDGRTKIGRKVRSCSALQKQQKTHTKEELAFFELLKLLLDPDPDKRPSIKDLLSREFFTELQASRSNTEPDNSTLPSRCVCS